MKFIGLIAITFMLASWTTVIGQEKSSPLKNWSGKWRGTLTNMPARPNAKTVEVTMEIGAPPSANNTCTMWRTTYAEGGVVKQVKDYRLCRGESAEDWFIDEGGGTKLTARWLGEVLVSPFKVDNFLLIATFRLSGETLEEEIVTIDDKPAIKGVQPLIARSLQRIELKRVPPGL